MQSYFVFNELKSTTFMFLIGDLYFKNKCDNFSAISLQIPQWENKLHIFQKDTTLAALSLVGCPQTRGSY